MIMQKEKENTQCTTSVTVSVRFLVTLNALQCCAQLRVELQTCGHGYPKVQALWAELWHCLAATRREQTSSCPHVVSGKTAAAAS